MIKNIRWKVEGAHSVLRPQGRRRSWKIKIFTMLLLLTSYFSLLTAVYAELKIAEIPFLELREGSVASLNLGDYIYNTAKEKNIDISFDNTKNVQCHYSAGALLVKPAPDFYGLTYFSIEAKNAENEKCRADIIVKVKRKNAYSIKYVPDGNVKTVFAAGSFNSWNSSALEMKKNEKGEYSAELALEPGEYQYKLVVDGKWIADPGNPDTAPDGFGGKNSVISIGGVRPELLPSAKKPDELAFGYTGGKMANCLATSNNTLISPELKNDIVIVKNQARQGNFKIIACDINGSFSNEIMFSSSNNFNWQDGVIYFAFIDRFCDGDKNNDKKMDDPEVAELANYLGGDLDGIIKKINDGYFTKFGINILWISPVIDNPDKAYREDNPPFAKYSAYHGYWPLDIYKVEERFGTEQKLQELVDAAHSNGIKVLLDAVFNHVHIESDIYIKHPGWFTPLELPDGRKNIRLFDEFPCSTWFDSFNPTFDFERSTEARKIMIDNAVWWIEKFNIDGFRLDAVKHIPHVFFRELRGRIKNEIEFPQGKTFFMVGETISSRSKIMEYVGDSELNSQFDFPLYWAIRDVFAWQTQGFKHMEQEIKNSQTAYGAGRPMSVFIGNHDFARFATLSNGDIKPNSNEKDDKIIVAPPTSETYKKIKLAMTFLMTNPGIPMIYYGDEIGLAGKGDPDNRRMMKFDLSAEEKDLFDYISKLILIRKQNPASRYGVNKTILAENDFYAYSNVWFDNEIVVVLNRSTSPAVRNLNMPGKWLNLMTGKETGLEKVELPPVSAAIFQKTE